jgi:hypothetical protein
MKSRIESLVNAIKRANFEEMVANGTAAGVAGRARTIPSKRDKSRDPRRQRRAFRGARWGE